MSKKKRGSRPAPEPPKKDEALKLPPAPKPRQGHKQGHPAAGAMKPKHQKGKPRQNDKANLKRGKFDE